MRDAMILGSVLLLGACNMSADAHEGERGSGAQAKRDFQVGAFDKVSLGGSQDVVVAVGGAASVRAEGDAETIDRLDIRVENGELKIGTKRNKDWSFGFHRDRAKVTIYVTAPALAGASIGGSGDMRIDKVAGDSFDASIAGSGDMQIGSLNVGAADFSIAGSGGIKASGAAQRAKFSIAGSGSLDAQGLQARQASISVMGSGDVTANASEAADVSVMGSGDVTMGGGGKCSVHKMGSGAVRCGA